MFKRVFFRFRNRVVIRITLLAAVAGGLLVAGRGLAPESDGAGKADLRKPPGSAQLVSVEPLPAMGVNSGMDGEMCQWVPASASFSFLSAFQEEVRRERAAAANDADREPVRVIRDSYPTFSAVAIDLKNNEMVLQDENLFQIMVYDRQANTPPTATMTEPKRIIGGHETKIEFNCGLYVDPESGDIYSVTNDTVDTLTIFSREVRGNQPPTRELRTPHGTFGIAVHEEREEMYLSVQHTNAIVTYRKMAEGTEQPLRYIKGPATQLEDPHGIAVDTRNDLLFVTNHGHARDPQGVGSSGAGGRIASAPWREDTTEDSDVGGWFEPPSITVYPLEAEGDVSPLRIIEGPLTGLNWPAHVYYDSENQEIFVANDADDSIVVFAGDATGNAAPIRVLKGSNTGIKNPTGILIDNVNDEMIVANMGNHSATVYRRDANGDAAPLRTMRGGPLGKLALAIGNPGAIAYDSKREEILVPN